MDNPFTIITILFFCALGGLHGLHLPNYIKPCSKSDTNFKECVVDHAKASYGKVTEGDRKYKLNKLVPLNLPLLEVDAGNNLQLTFKDLVINGLDELIITNLNFDLDKKQYDFHFIIPRLNFAGHYDINGRNLVLPILGSGFSNMTFVEGKYHHTFGWDIVKKDGEDFVKIKNPRLDFKLEKAYFFLGNLFNGDKTLGDNMNLVLNDNWQDVINEIGPGIGHTIETIITDIHRKYFDVVPYDELFLE